MNSSFIESVLLKKPSDRIKLHQKIDQMLRATDGQYILQVFNANKKTVEIKVVDIPDGKKPLFVRIRANRSHSAKAFIGISDIFKKDDTKFPITFTTGFCIPDMDIVPNSKANEMDACIWEAIVIAPADFDPKRVQELLLKLNDEYSVKVILSANVTELRVSE